MRRLWTCFLTGVACIAAAQVVSQITRHDLPAGIQSWLPPESKNFAAYIARLRQTHQDRIRRGEAEHLAYYVLQSTAFTSLPPVEPAILAFRSDVDTSPRIKSFVHALSKPTGDARMSWWQAYLRSDPTPARTVESAIAEATRFLRAKEVERVGPVAYQQRGYSSDTSLVPGFVVSEALRIIKGLDPAARVRRVLLIGPGLDFAPRTAMRNEVPPQSYQPYLTYKALLDTGFGEASNMTLHCVDINPRVVSFIRAQRTVVLPHELGGRDYESYLDGLTEEQVPFPNVEASVLDIVTERLAGQFDLVVATNLLVYFNTPELALAVSNIAAMTRPGGYFIHNEVRPELEQIARQTDLPVIHGRSIEIARGTRAPMFDAVVLHRRAEVTQRR